MVKCAKCTKVLNKKAPGLQCNKCSKWLHATCASMSTEQLTTIYSTESVDWKCKSCSGASKPKRVSCILPEDDGEDYTDAESNSIAADSVTNNTTQQILREIRIEVRAIIREELQRTLQFYSDKIDDFENKMLTYDKTVKNMENQCTDLRNNLRNVNLKYKVLENKVNQLDQAQLVNQLEICGIQEQEKENLEEIVQKIAVSIQQNPEDIVKAYRRKKRRPNTSAKKEQSPITVVLREGIRDQWLESAKNTKISAASIVDHEETTKIYLRECLTPATAFLLWKTKEELKGVYSYIWCKHGNILIRKCDKAKIIAIRSVQDVENAKSLQQNIQPHQTDKEE